MGRSIVRLFRSGWETVTLSELDHSLKTDEGPESSDLPQRLLPSSFSFLPQIVVLSRGPAHTRLKIGTLQLLESDAVGGSLS